MHCAPWEQPIRELAETIRPEHDDDVTLRLARRLLREVAVPRREIETALVAATRGVPFVRALISAHPELELVVERDLLERHGPPLSAVVPQWDWVALLPCAMCERLLAVPAQVDPPGPLYVAVVDPDDEHVAEEFRYHLGEEPRLVRAEYRQIVAMVERLTEADRFPRPSVLPVATARMGSDPGSRSPELHPGTSDQRSPTAEQPAPRRRPLLSVPPARLPSEPPIPLVRRTSGSRGESRGAARSKLKTHPGLGEAGGSAQLPPRGERRWRTVPGLGSIPEVDAPGGGDEVGRRKSTPTEGEGKRRPTVVPPPILVEPLAPRAGVSLLAESGHPSPGTERGIGQDENLSGLPVATPPAIELPSELQVEQQLDEAESTSEVAERLVHLAESLAERVIVFSVRKGSYVAYARSSRLEGSGRATQIAIVQGEPSILEAACRAGYYLGPVTSGTAQASLLSAFDIGPTTELYATPVSIAERPVLVLVAAGLDKPFAATKWLDSLAAVAARVLGRRLRTSNHARR